MVCSPVFSTQKNCMNPTHLHPRFHSSETRGSCCSLRGRLWRGGRLWRRYALTTRLRLSGGGTRVGIEAAALGAQDEQRAITLSLLTRAQVGQQCLQRRDIPVAA